MPSPMGMGFDMYGGMDMGMGSSATGDSTATLQCPLCAASHNDITSRMQALLASGLQEPSEQEDGRITTEALATALTEGEERALVACIGQGLISSYPPQEPQNDLDFGGFGGL